MPSAGSLALNSGALAQPPASQTLATASGALASSTGALASVTVPGALAAVPALANRATAVASAVPSAASSAARGREAAVHELLFVGCVPDPRWSSGLARRGIEVGLGGVEEATRRISERPPACLVLDADGGTAGLGALRAELERAAPGLPVALLASATALFAAMADWKSHPASHVLLKPVELDDLLAIIEPLGAPPAPRLPSLERLQREYIRAVLIACEGNVSEAARQLGMYRQSLQRMLRRHPAPR